MKPIMIAVILLLTLSFTASGVVSSQHEVFTEERFEELQKGGELVLLDVHATWCTTCKKQQAILAEFREKHPGTKLHVLQIDFDKQKEWVRHFKAPRQSTLFLYRDGKQLWFSVAETRKDPIFAAILEAAEQK